MTEVTDNEKAMSGKSKSDVPKALMRAFALVSPLLLIAPAAGCSDKVSDSPNISYGESETNPGAISDNANSGFIADQKAGQSIRFAVTHVEAATNKTTEFIPGNNWDYLDDLVYDSIRLTASSNSEKPLQGVNWRAMWASPYVGGNVSDYVSITKLTSDGLTAQVNIVKPFANEILLTAVSAENENVTGSASLKYVRRVSDLLPRIGAENGTDDYINFDSENAFVFSCSAIMSAGTLSPAVTYKYYAKFTSAFSDNADNYIEINRSMTGAEWLAFLTEHAKDGSAIDELLASENGNDGRVSLYCTATVSYGGKAYQFITSEPIIPRFGMTEELITSVTELSLTDVNGSTSEIEISGGTGEYTIEVSESLRDSVTATLNGNVLTLAYHYTEEVSGTIKITSGDQTVTITVELKNPDVVCLTGDTLITLANGSAKRIDQIEYTDKILAIDPETGEFCSTSVTYTDAKINKSYNHYDRFEFDDGTVVTVVHRHRFYNVEDQRMIHLDAFSLGDRAYKIDGTCPRLISAIEHYEEKETMHYTIFTEKQNYFANGLLSGNRFTKNIAKGVN